MRMWIEYDDGGKQIWRGLYQNGRQCVTKRTRGMKEFYSEMNMKGELLSVIEYDED